MLNYVVLIGAHDFHWKYSDCLLLDICKFLALLHVQVAVYLNKMSMLLPKNMNMTISVWKICSLTQVFELEVFTLHDEWSTNSSSLPLYRDIFF